MECFDCFSDYSEFHCRLCRVNLCQDCFYRHAGTFNCPKCRNKTCILYKTEDISTKEIMCWKCHIENIHVNLLNNE